MIRLLPCVECGIATRSDRPRCPYCQRKANARFLWTSLLIIVAVVITFI